ncbi:transposase [Neptuniibacter sp.]|uniref:IS66-like element accessory protein TnpA n=1 Tax=Neptuniibacter sp. TaxID=1962643 RepID=UPI003380ECAA|nr:transposase [Neptuniibacter sp.]
MMTTLSIPAAQRKRRRFSPEFKARILDACQQPNTSVASVALEHNLNANLVRKWIRNTRPTPDQPDFIPLPQPQSLACRSGRTDPIRIEIPHRRGAVVIEWPLSGADTCQTLLRDLLQ